MPKKKATKKKAAKKEPELGLAEAAEVLLGNIAYRGLSNQVGAKSVRIVQQCLAGIPLSADDEAYLRSSLNA